MEREFIEYCRENNLEGVNDYLSRGVAVNTKDNRHRQMKGLMELRHSVQTGPGARAGHQLPG